jgi:hypothetical protein
MSKNELPTQFDALALETDLANLVKSKEYFGEYLTSFMLHEFGLESKNTNCVVSPVEGDDAGKMFIADVYKAPRFLEPLTIALKAAKEQNS